MLNTLVNIKTPLTLADKDKPFVTSTMSFQAGQWIDVKDSIDQWLEGQITKVRGERVLVHYNGWGNRWDEWFDMNSPRIALFRTHTIQMVNNRYTCPSPNIKPDADNHEIPPSHSNINDVLGQTSSFLEKVRNMTELYLNLSRHEEQLRKLTIGEESKKGSMEERRKQQMAAQIAPLMDRLGRVLIDLSPHLYSSAYTETEQTEERKVDRSFKIPPLDNPKDISIVTSIMDRLLFTETPRIELHIHASLNQQVFNNTTHPQNNTSANPREGNNRSNAIVQTEDTKKKNIGIGTEVKHNEMQVQTEMSTQIIEEVKENVISPVVPKQTIKRTIIRHSMNPKKRKINEQRLVNPIQPKHKTMNPTRVRK